MTARPPVDAWIVRLAREVLNSDPGLGYPRVAAGCSRGVSNDGGAMLAESDECRAMRLAIDELIETSADRGQGLLQWLRGDDCSGPDVHGAGWLGDRVDEILGDR